ncbi:unnamed protein product [Rotaria sp. Silwood1]|nr:unnamed protein product [Rotaria sp. Silwood1]
MVGGEEYFQNVSTETRKLFQQGIISAALNTNAWIITNGLHLGVAKEVGLTFDQLRYKNIKAVQNIRCIGIVNWNSIAYKSQLAQWHTTIPNLKRERLYRTWQLPVEEIPKTFPLDHNHTHFLMFNVDPHSVDPQDDINRLVRLRTEFEENLQINTKYGQPYVIPIVQILIGGNISSITSVCTAIRRKIPVIAITGTSGVADLIIHEYRYLYGENQIRSEDEYENARQQPQFNDYHLKETFGPNQETLNGITRQFTEMMKSREGYFLLNSFALSENEPESQLDDVILNAHHHAVQIAENPWEKRASNLILAIACKKYERVKQYIYEHRSTMNWPFLELDKPLMFTMHQNDVRFIELFIEDSRSFERLRRIITADGLYKNLNENDRSAMLPIVDKKGDIRQMYYATCFKPNTIKFYSNAQGFIRDLLLWTILMDRFHMTTFLCSQTENTIVASLLASKIYQIAAESEKNFEKKLVYRNRKKIFDEHATIIMNRCFNIHEDLAVQILTSHSEVYFDYSPLELAEEIGSQSFLGTKCVQKYLDRQWSGAIIGDTNSSICIRALQTCLINPICLPGPGFEFFRSPCVRFRLNILFTIMFLFLFSTVLLHDYRPSNGNKENFFGISWKEIFVHICMIGIIADEIFQSL